MQTGAPTEPLISVVTPFYNTAPYLAQCIESVLAQSYSHFEYILSDNCSTDGSGAIAAAYASRDPRIRLVRQAQLLPQAEHYNHVLAGISNSSHYCKIVQADDYIFPECLRLMKAAFEQSESVGLVSSYYLKGNIVRGSGFPYPAPLMPGKDMARLFLRTGLFVFGSESTVMYRSSLVRACQPFYDASSLHADTEKCIQLLEQWDFGFVHQILSFLRMDNVNESISASVRGWSPDDLDNYITTQRYADAFLEAGEAAALKKRSKRAYYHALAKRAVQLPAHPFWAYHQKGLKTLGETLDRSCLARQIGKELLWMAINPGLLVERVLRARRRNISPPARPVSLSDRSSHPQSSKAEPC